MGGMLVTVAAGSVELAAFDYETCARYRLAADSDGTGTVLVSGAELAAAVKSLPKGKGGAAKTLPAMLTVSDNGLVIECDGTSVTLAAMDASEYPQLPPVPPHAGDIDAAVFAAAVARVAACAGKDDTLPTLTCIHLASDETGAVGLAATDRYRLGTETVHWTGTEKWDVLIPAATLTGFVKKMRKDGKVSVHLADTADGPNVALSDGTLTVMTRLNCGTFPRYRALIRAEAGDTTVITADAKTLATAVDGVGAMVERNGRLSFDVAGGRVTLTAMLDGAQVATRSVPVTQIGPDIETGFCPAYLLSLLTGITGQARIGLVHPDKPATVRGGEFTGVVMPIRLAK